MNTRPRFFERSSHGQVQRFLAMAVDFARSLAEDMSGMFRAPNYVSREMTPGGGMLFEAIFDQKSLKVFVNFGP